MQKCCIKGCDSHKYVEGKKIGYFQFPVHDDILLKKWLTQIDLPDWQPGVYHRICSMHFRGEDVDSHPNRKQPYLNPTSIPTIFPGQATKTARCNLKQSTILPKASISMPLRAIRVSSNGKCEMSVLRSTPMILIPARIAVQNPAQFPLQRTMQTSTQNQSSAKNSVAASSTKTQNPVFVKMEEFPKASETFSQQLSILQPRLRKILPKPDDISVPIIGSLPAVENILEPLPVPKPDIRIVPMTKTTHPNDSSITVPHRYPGNKRPILRISINKRRNGDATKKSPCNSNENVINGSGDEAEMKDMMDRASPSGKAITIENSSTNRTVTFRLDPKTGEIVVTTQQTNDSSRDEEDLESTRAERKVDDTCARLSAAKLRQLYTKGQRECNALRKRLKILRQRHREEQEEIEKLQECLTQIGDKVQKTCCEDTSESPSTKRNEAGKSVRSLNTEDYENLIREVKKIKQDIGETKRGLSSITNGQLDIRSRKSLSRLTGNNGDSKLLVDNQDNRSDYLKSRNGEIVDQRNEKCNNDVRTTHESSIKSNPDLGSHDTICREEFLDTEFLFE